MRQKHAHIVQVYRILHGRFRARARNCRIGLAIDLGSELGQSVDRRPPLGEGSVAADEPGQRLVNTLKCMRGLNQHTELDRAGEISRRGDQQPKERGELAEQQLEYPDTVAAQDDPLEIVV